MTNSGRLKIYVYCTLRKGIKSDLSVHYFFVTPFWQFWRHKSYHNKRPTTAKIPTNGRAHELVKQHRWSSMFTFTIWFILLTFYFRFHSRKHQSQLLGSFRQTSDIYTQKEADLVHFLSQLKVPVRILYFKIFNVLCFLHWHV